MIEIGKYHTLEILRETSVGLFLGDADGEDILLPNKYCPERFAIGDRMKVFVYRDNMERKIATTLTPAILMHRFASLRVVQVSDAGAFMDWGLEKHLFVPFSKQKQRMEEGRYYVVYLDLDEQTDRLFASSHIEQRLNNDRLTVKEGEEVKLLVFKHTDLGFSVIINQIHSGLVYANEIFREIRVGDTLKGYVRKIREGNKLDISLQPIGYPQANDANTGIIYRALQANGGFLPFTDHSSPDEISKYFGMSKKAFKKAVGALYKDRMIAMKGDGIQLL